MTDTLQIDHELLRQLQQDPSYAYAMGEEKSSLFGQFAHWFGEWLARQMSGDASSWRLVALLFCSVGVAMLAWWLWERVQLRRFGVSRLVTSVEAEEADIHSVDFDYEIAQAEASKDYARAACLLYLQTLKKLSDDHRIDWRPQKTPMDYTREVDNEDFDQLTDLFMRIRYGGKQAGFPTFIDMRVLQRQVLGEDWDEVEYIEGDEYIDDEEEGGEA